MHQKQGSKNKARADFMRVLLTASLNYFVILSGSRHPAWLIRAAHRFQPRPSCAVGNDMRLCYEYDGSSIIDLSIAYVHQRCPPAHARCRSNGGGADMWPSRHCERCAQCFRTLHREQVMLSSLPNSDALTASAFAVHDVTFQLFHSSVMIPHL